MPEPAMNDPEATHAANESKPTPVIFVVDDSPDSDELVEFILNSAGYQARVFSDPLTALSALSSADPKPSLLVTDFRMPRINGMELIQRCKAIQPELKVISASATLGEEEMARYRDKPDRLLPKPYSTTQLLQVVKSLLAE